MKGYGTVAMLLGSSKLTYIAEVLKLGAIQIAYATDSSLRISIEAELIYAALLADAQVSSKQQCQIRDLA